MTRVHATARVLERAGLTHDDIDAYEVNEAFASVPLAWLAETGADARSSTRAAAPSPSGMHSGHPERGS